MSSHLSTLLQAHLEQLQNCLQEAENTDNPAISLFQNNARTYAFYLEAIARFQYKIQRDKQWEKWREDFKTIEDGIGYIDYWYSLFEEAKSIKKIPTEIKSYFEYQWRKSCQTFNQTLMDGNWIWNDNKKLKKIARKIEALEWPEEDEIVSDLTKYYYKEIEKIEGLLSKENKNIEADLHELRREIRWLSILPQALAGYCQLKSDKPNSALKKYLTPEIIHSPYNVFKEVKSIKEKLIFQKSAYLSMSWLIAFLGDMKDAGQRIEAFSKAYRKTFALNETEIEEELNTLFKKKINTTQEVLRQSNEVTSLFFAENILEHLIVI